MIDAYLPTGDVSRKNSPASERWMYDLSRSECRVRISPRQHSTRYLPRALILAPTDVRGAKRDCAERGTVPGSPAIDRPVLDESDGPIDAIGGLVEIRGPSQYRLRHPSHADRGVFVDSV